MIGYAVWDRAHLFADPFYRQYMRDLYETIRIAFPEIVVSDDFDVLKKAPVDHLVVFSVGHHSRSGDRLRVAIEKFCERDFLTAADVWDDHCPMCILNLNNHRRKIDAPLLPLSQEIRANKRYLHPFSNTDRFADCLKLLQQDALHILPDDLHAAQRHYLTSLMSPGSSCSTFIFNNEPLDISIHGSPKRMFGLAAGFKLFVLWSKLRSPEVVFFDHNQRSLDYWQYVVEHWSGEDFESFYQPEPHHTFSGTIANNMQDVYAEVGDVASLWREFQKTKPKFILCDLLRNPERIVEMMEPKDFVWYSNCFYFMESIERYGLAELAERKARFLNMLPDVVSLDHRRI